jgi:hypothetical protein
MEYELGERDMVLKPSKDKALEALDLIINVLREHEKAMDNLVGELSNITERLGETDDISSKIERIEECLASLQNCLTDLVNRIVVPQSTPAYSPRLHPLTVKCREWKDFRKLAASAEIVSFIFESTEKLFQAYALKKGRIFSYHGEFPEDTLLLKFWLSKQLNIDEQNIFEGTLNYRI